MCLSLCLSVCSLPHSHTTARTDVTWGNCRGCHLVVHYWADLQSVRRFHCYDDIVPKAKCQHMLVLALCLVFSDICCRPSVCLSSVTFIRPTQAVQIFGNISMALGTFAIRYIYIKCHGDRPRGTPPPGELNTIGVAKYSDFGPIDGYISETVQDRR